MGWRGQHSGSWPPCTRHWEPRPLRHGALGGHSAFHGGFTQCCCQSGPGSAAGSSRPHEKVQTTNAQSADTQFWSVLHTTWCRHMNLKTPGCYRHLFVLVTEKWCSSGFALCLMLSCRLLCWTVRQEKRPTSPQLVSSSSCWTQRLSCGTSPYSTSKLPRYPSLICCSHLISLKQAQLLVIITTQTQEQGCIDLIHCPHYWRKPTGRRKTSGLHTEKSKLKTEKEKCTNKCINPPIIWEALLKCVSHTLFLPVQGDGPGGDLVVLIPAQFLDSGQGECICVYVCAEKWEVV